MMLSVDENRRDSFFNAVVESAIGSGKEKSAVKDVSVAIVAHVFPTCLGIINALKKHFTLKGMIPKRGSRTPSSMLWLTSQDIPVIDLNRDSLEDPLFLRQQFVPLFDSTTSSKVLLLDIGGYFAAEFDVLIKSFGTRLIGCIEDTENGAQKYEGKIAELGSVSVPVFSVARSPLKDPEDYWVGKSVVFSTETLMRSCYRLLSNCTTAVVGYGKIGKSIAHDLTGRGLRVLVIEQDPIRRIEAHSRGFETPELSDALKIAEVVFSATGNKALQDKHLALIKPGTFLASVTSREDEWPDLQIFIEKHSNTHRCQSLPDGEAVLSCRFAKEEAEPCYVLNNGNAVNFLHNAVCGSYIYLIQAEILWVACQLAKGSISSAKEGTLYETPLELDKRSRETIADLWHKHFA